jgi:hypothetical protein
MAVTLTEGLQQSKGGTFMGIENLTQSTTTVPQTLSVTKQVSVLGMGTATGGTRNRYNLPTTGLVEGMEKYIRAEATGEAWVNIGGGHAGRLPANIGFQILGAATAVDALAVSATANWAFTATGQTLGLKVIDGVWRYIFAGSALGPTLGTGT